MTWRRWRPHPLWLLLACAAPGDSEDVVAKEEDDEEQFARKAVYLPPPAEGPDGAYTDCPCVRSSELARQGKAERGSHCKAWDKRDDGPCSSPEPPNWCTSRWCYVDAYHCNRSHTRSILDTSVDWSYETCGDLGSHYEDHRSAVRLVRTMGRPLVVWASGHRVEDYMELRPDMNLDMRASLTFASRVLDHLKVDVKDPRQMIYRELSAAAQARHPSSRYTACVHDIALGNVDLCLGPVWDTDERRAMNVSFTGSIFVEEMSLLMPVSERRPNVVSSILFRTFEPFSPGLWLLIFATIGLSALAMVCFDHWLTPTAAEVSSLQHPRSAGTTLTAWLHSFLAGEVTFMPATSGGKLFSVGYGFFVLVCSACYTANMATILISEDQGQSRISTIKDALQSGMEVCYHAALPITTVRLLYPGLDKLGRAVDGSLAGLEVWKQQGCQVAVLSDMMMADGWAKKRDCDWFLKRPPVMNVPNGFYSSNALAHEVSWMASKLRLDGTWDRVLHQVKRPSLCGKAADGDGANQQLNAGHMMGAVVILLLCFLGGLLVHSYELSHSSVDWSNLQQLGKIAVADNRQVEDGASSDSSSVDWREAKYSVSAANRDSLHLESVQLQLRTALHQLEELQFRLPGSERPSPNRRQFAEPL